MQIKFLIVALFCYIIVSCSKRRFDNVFKMKIKNSDQLDFLQKFNERDNGCIFYEPPVKVGQQIDIAVPPDMEEKFGNIVARTNIAMRKMTNNLQSVINNETKVDTNSMGNRFGWNRFYPLEKIYHWLDTLPVRFPSMVTRFTIGRTYEGRPIKGIKISFKSNNPGIFVESNIHAREWITSATSTWLINELLTSSDRTVKYLAKHFDWYFIPVANPDGFVYTHTTDRFWRKTRKPSSSKCFGSDPNRNFHFYWNTSGGTSDPCSDTYPGKSPFSESESLAIAKFYSTIAHKITIYISLHAYGQLLMYPYGTNETAPIRNKKEIEEIGSSMVSAIYEKYGTAYTFGDIMTVIYAAAGSSCDWVKGIHNTPIVFAYEMRDKGKDGFMLPPEQIIPNSEEVLASFKAMIDQAFQKGYFSRSRKSRQK